MRTLLSIDLSTSSTGFSVFDIETKELKSYTFIKPSTKGLSKLVYPEKQLVKMHNYALILKEYIDGINPDIIVIEEIAGSKQRMGQKTLDGMHWILLKHIEHHINKVHYYDVTGKNGWRFHLQLKLDDADKAHNKEFRKLNKTLAKGTKKIPIIGPKHLAARYVNRVYKLNLDVDENPSDNDMADSIAMGSAFLLHRVYK
tara:strand:+ start:80405 stop:81004 length:600 start_codon:yes stop_codon:yes gene_type:complete